MIATGSGRTARLWDVYLCRPIGPPMEQPAEINGVYFSTDARWLLVKCTAKGAIAGQFRRPGRQCRSRTARVQEMTR